MNTHSNAYVTKFSSGTILALLAISGLFFLVPATSPVFAANASVPTISVTSNNPVLGGSASNVVAVKISNPTGNVYTITGFSIVAASGWTVTAASSSLAPAACAYWPSATNTASGALYTVSTYTVGTGAGIPPGQNCVVTFTATAPTGTYPVNSVFTTSVQDASAVGYYNGPSFTVQAIDPGTVTTIAVTANGPNTATTYEAGTAAYTVTATVTGATAQVGLTINFVDTGTGAASSSFGASSVATTAATATTATATTTFQPSNTVGLTGVPKVTIGTCTAGGCTATSLSTITTVAGAPSTVTVSAGGTSAGADYIIVSATPGFSTSLYAQIPFSATGITGVLKDAFGNSVIAGMTWAVGQGCTIISFGGSFDSAGVSTVTDTIAGGTATYCTNAATPIEANLNYYQSLNYGTTTTVQVSMTGSYTPAGLVTATGFSASGLSKNIITSTMDAAVPAAPSTPGLTTSPTQAAVAGAGGISAGSTAGVASTITLTYQLTTAQSGVPVIFLGVNTTAYLGSFVGGMGTSIHRLVGPITDFANITVATTISGGVATASATFTVDTTVPHSVGFSIKVARPIIGAPGNTIAMAAPYGPFTTKAGAPAKLSVLTYFDSALAVPTTKSVAGQNIFLNVILQDYWGNTATNSLGSQLNIFLAVSPSSAGAFSASSVYIPASGSTTAAGFGTIALVLSSSVALGTLTISATGLYSGTSTLKIVSPNPTITVSTPANSAKLSVVGHTIYSGFAGVAYSGSSGVSAGVYLPPTIANIYYTVDGGASTSACAGGACTSWSFTATLANGLHTIVAWSKDSAGLLSTTNSTTVLVDTTSPTITAPTNLAYQAGQSVVFTITASLGDLKASSVTVSVNGTALTAGASSGQTFTLSGTNNPGSSVTYTVTVTGLAATMGHYGITVGASSLAGNSATAVTAVVTVTVQQAQSLVVQGTPTSGKVGNYQGVSVTYQNVWSSSQSVVVFAVWKNSLGQTVYISAGSATLANGASQSFFLPEVGLASGTYTVNLFVWTTSNTSVSATTPVTVTF